MQMQNFEKRVWAEIDLDALRANFRTVKQRAGSLPLCAVVKADSYGHGAVQCARVFAQEGAPGWLSAAWPRPCSCAGAARPCPSSFWAMCSRVRRRLIRDDITAACYSLPQAKALSEAAEPPGAGSSASGCGYRHGPHRLCSAHRF
mgnify:CR=1 FL=1